MRVRRMSAVALLALTLVAPTGIAGASGESIGACVVEAVREAEELDLPEEATERRAAEAAEACIQAGESILPNAFSEILWGAVGVVFLAGPFALAVVLSVRLLLKNRRQAE